MMDAKVSKNKHISRWVDQENVVLDKIYENAVESMLDKTKSKTMHKDKKGD